MTLETVCLSTKGRLISASFLSISPTKWTTQVTKVANDGDILMSVRAPVGALNICVGSICIGRGVGQPPAQNKASGFFYYLLLANNKLVIGNGGSIFDSINKSQIEKIAIPVPLTIDEQQKIADCLTSLDEVIAAQGRKVEALKAHKRGLMQQLFPREGETLPRLRFPEFHDAPEWEETSISGMGEVVTGSTPATSQKDYYSGEHHFVSPADISELRFIETTKKDFK